MNQIKYSINIIYSNIILLIFIIINKKKISLKKDAAESLSNLSMIKNIVIIVKGFNLLICYQIVQII